MNKIEIRKVETNDLPALAKVYVKSYTANKEEHWTSKTSQLMLTQLYNRQRDLAYLAESNNKIIGAFLTETKYWWDGNHLFNGELFVDPAFQKKGIGKQLLKKVLSLAIKKYKITIFAIITFKGDYQANWYKRLGFEDENGLVLMSGNPTKILSTLNKK